MAQTMTDTQAMAIASTKSPKGNKAAKAVKDQAMLQVYGISRKGYMPLAMPTGYMEDFADKYYKAIDFGGTMTGEAMSTTQSVLDGLESYIQNNVAAQRAEATQTAIDTTVTTTQQLNALLADEFYGAMDVANPGWRDQLTALSDQTLDSVQLSQFLNDKYAKPLAESGLNAAQKLFSISDSLMNGEIPKDVQAQMEKGMAEQSWRTGSTSGVAEGSFGSSLYQNLGLTSLQMVSLGSGMANQANQLYGTTMADLNTMQTSGFGAANSMTSLAKQYMPAQVDASAIFAREQSALAPAASDVFNLFGSMASGSLNTQESNNQQYLSLMEGALARYDSIASGNASVKSGVKLANMASNSAKDAAMISAAGSIGGAALGAGIGLL